MAEMKIEASACKAFVRLTINGRSIIMPIGEFSRRLADPGKFVMTAADLQVVANLWAA